MAFPLLERATLFLLLLCSSDVILSGASAEETVTQEADIIIEGIVKLDVPVRLKSSSVKILINGGEHHVFVRANGYFAFRIEPGTHFLQVAAVGAVFPQVRLDVSARHRGRYKATVQVDGKTMHTSMDELTIAPIGPEVYFEKREPFNVMTLVKSPVGIMAVVMLVGAFVLPSLMEGIDPEEMKQMQEQMKSAPSVTSLLSGGSASGPLAPPAGGRR